MLRIPHCQDNTLTDGVKVSLMSRPRSTPQKHFSGTHFCWSLCHSQSEGKAERIRSVENLTDGSEDVSLKHRPRSTRLKHFLVLISVIS
jgi:hypothetical protein